MNVLRKTSLFVLVAFVAVFAFGVLSSSAEAGGGCHSYSFSSYCPTYKYCDYPSYKYCNYGSYDCYGGYCYWPTTYNCYKPVCYPVTNYDCYGRPYVVWQTSYSYAP
jgi:hypothetical protein